jgi:nucleoid-associated protein YgaU
MNKNRYSTTALVLALASMMTFAGCSSSEVSDTNEVSADELPVVDASTDQLPDQLDQGAGAEVAQQDGAPVTADGLSPEVSTDLPQNADAATDPTAVDQAVAQTEPTTEPANTPSYDAPPSMNETAPAETAVASTSGGGSEVYEVKGGDTLMKIAFMVYGDVYQWRKVLSDNSDRISDPGRLVKGTQLKVDNAPNEDYYNGYERYLIKGGDTLGIISDDVYGTKKKWKSLWKMNDGLVKDPNRIYAGFFLRYTMTEQERQEAERLKSMHSAPLAGASGAEEPAPADREPSSFQEAKVPSTATNPAN